MARNEKNYYRDLAGVLRNGFGAISLCHLAYHRAIVLSVPRSMGALRSVHICKWVLNWSALAVRWVFFFPFLCGNLSTFRTGRGIVCDTE